MAPEQNPYFAAGSALEALTTPDAPAPTLGVIAKKLRKMKGRGVTRGAVLFVVDQVWWEREARP